MAHLLPYIYRKDRTDECPCPICNGKRTEDMVKCLLCQGMFHAKCANINKTTRSTTTWECFNCRQMYEILEKHEKVVNENQKLKKLQQSEEKIVEQDSQSQFLATIAQTIGIAVRETSQQFATTTRDLLQHHQASSVQVSSVPGVNTAPIRTSKKIVCELPKFSGEPMDWPAFKRAFIETSVAGDFTRFEDVNRLKNALKGKALEHVERFLKNPNQIKMVLNLLQSRFGNSQIIYDNLKDKVMKCRPAKSNNADLIQLNIAIGNLIETMKIEGATAYFTDLSLIDAVVEKLPTTLQDKWYEKLNQDAPQGGADQSPSSSSSEPRNNGLRDYQLETACFNNNKVYTIEDVYEFIQGAVQVANHRDGKRDDGKMVRTHNLHLEVPKEIRKQKIMFCHFCNSRKHYATDCKDFQNLTCEKRLEYSKKNKICFSCLKFKHYFKDCRSSLLCGKNGCTQKHHPLLHDAFLNGHEEKSSHTSMVHYKTCRSRVIFQIIPIVLYNGSRKVKTFAFLDTGSSCTMMEQCIADKLGLTGSPEKLKLLWSNDITHTEENSICVTVSISGYPMGKRYLMKNVRTVRTLNIPSQSIDRWELQQWSHLQGVNVDSYRNAKATVLIGMDQAHLIVARDIRDPGMPNRPLAIKTLLGWSIFGNVLNESNQFCFRVREIKKDDQYLHDLVKEHFAIDNIGIKLKEEKFDSRAEELMKKTLSFDGTKYTIGLLWRKEEVALPQSFEIAKKRLEYLEKKLENNSSLKKWYTEKMDEHIKRGFMVELSVEEANRHSWRTFYLPHFAVINPNKVPLKPRLVFDAAAKVDGKSLNSHLLKGPDNITSLIHTLVKFRIGETAVMADVKEMFHTIGINKEDQDAQRILWRDSDAKKPLKTFVFTRMIFGASDSPSKSQFVKNINAERFLTEKPDGAVIIINNTYVDDLTVSFQEVELASKACKEAIDIWANAGCVLRNFVSNSTQLLDSLPKEYLADRNELALGDYGTQKVLGIYWKVDSDVITFRLSRNKIDERILKLEKIPTKREILSIIMSIYDPLGYLAHKTIQGKIILQEVWLSGIDWDDEIPQGSFVKWKKWYGHLSNIESIEIPRQYTRLTSVEAMYQVHVFVDASDKAYGCVIYLRAKLENMVDIAIIGAKAKVLPLNPPSVPRSELQAALIGTRLWKSLSEAITYDISEVFYWTDSTTVLGWLHADRAYKPYVANRIAEIREETTLKQWRWVPTKENPADETTKLIQASKWFSGPSFLKLEPEFWPKRDIKITDPDLEAKPVMRHQFVTKSKITIIDPKRYSDWYKLLFHVTTLLKFVKWLKNKKDFIKIYTVDEMRYAEKWLIRMAQSDEYGTEIELLKNGEPVQEGPLKQFNPLLGDDMIIRLNGRLNYCKILPPDARNPIILPNNHAVTNLIVRYYHVKYLHQGTDTIIAAIRKKYWIPKIRNVVKRAKSNCQFCKNESAKPIPPMMGQLPTYRTQTYVKPFLYAGVDYFGPITVTIGRRREKRWVALFCCMVTRAIHLELASSLSTDSFILCLRNVMNLRGKIAEIFSDNGTNFVGANNELIRQAKNLDIKWTFIPSNSPHFGGSWERLVRSVKSALTVILKDHALKEETLRSALSEAQNICNSRPLTNIPLEHFENEPLTPNHFLFGPLGGEIAPSPYDGEQKITRKQWVISQNIAHQFWRRWISEYLPTLNLRKKWFTPSNPIKIGDVVVIVEDNQRNSWKKGIVEQVTKAKDGQVRSCVVRTNTGTYTRPAVKLAVLDV